jgi:NAD(P)-dependent dehydrogenase (short-subunit alcohol dehydrogenase family)
LWNMLAVTRVSMHLGWLPAATIRGPLSADTLLLTAYCVLLPPAGLIGYSAYAPSKFAVRGLAECLRNEVRG